MRKPEWNEEYAVKFTLDGHEFSTRKGYGFMCEFEAKDEAKRVKAKGAKKIKIYIQKWN